MPPHDIPHDPLHNDLFHRASPARHLDNGVTRALRVGIGGPVGSGKTTLVGSLCRLLRDDLSLVVVTNDIFTSEDAKALRASAVLPEDRIAAVETGCCPHTAIRDDIAANLDAVEQLEAQHGQVDVTLTVSNPNTTVLVMGSLALDTTQGASGFAVDVAHAACTTASLTFTSQTNAGAGWNVPAMTGTTDGSLAISLPDALHMSVDAANACQGAQFTVYLVAGP